MELRELGEDAWIRSLQSLYPDQDLTDDCAVVEAGCSLQLVSTDMLVEGTHFRRDWSSPSQIGEKLVEVNVSDIVSSGGVPSHLSLAVGVPGHTSFEWLQEVYRGIKRACERHQLRMIGGDTVRSPGPCIFSVTIVGSVEASRLKRRGNARPGDALVLSRPVGLSRAGLLLLENSLSGPDALFEAHKVPRADSEAAYRFAAQPAVHAMMDLSDGLAADLPRLCQASGVGARVDLDRLEIHPLLQEVALAHGWSPSLLAVQGGEDYALLIAMDPAATAGLQVIGVCTEEPNVRYFEAGAERAIASGYEHFGSNPQA